MPETRSNPLEAGAWLGIDIGSRKKKICSFCLIESDGAGEISVSFERGVAGDGYPDTNTAEALIDLARSPTYLRKPVEAAVRHVLDGSQVTRRWLARARSGTPRTSVAVDAPVELALEGPRRLTEAACSQSIESSTRADFEKDLRHKGDAFLRNRAFWKCVGFTVYLWLGE